LETSRHDSQRKISYSKKFNPCAAQVITENEFMTTQQLTQVGSSKQKLSWSQMLSTQIKLSKKKEISMDRKSKVLSPNWENDVLVTVPPADPEEVPGVEDH
jgi:hypothetical protein